MCINHRLTIMWMDLINFFGELGQPGKFFGPAQSGTALPGLALPGSTLPCSALRRNPSSPPSPSSLLPRRRLSLFLGASWDSAVFQLPRFERIVEASVEADSVVCLCFRCRRRTVAGIRVFIGWWFCEGVHAMECPIILLKSLEGAHDLHSGHFGYD
jgi:hypothetical protein